MPDIKESWAVAAVFLVLGNLGVACLLSILYRFGLPEIPESVLYILSMIPPFMWIVMKGRRNMVTSREYVPVNSPDFGSLGSFLTFLMSALALLGVTYVIEPLYSWIPMSDAVREIFEKVFNGGNPVDLFISASILAPLCEEFLCRGVILRGLLVHTSPVKAILISSLIFAVIHMNPWQAIPAFIVGCLIGWLYYRTHSYWVCVFMHFLNNSMSQLMGVIFPDAAIDDTFYSVLPHFQYYIIFATAMAVAVAVILLLNKRLTDDEETVSFEIRSNL